MSVSHRAIIVGGVNLETVGFIADDIRGHRSMPRRTLPTTNVPGAIGPVVVSNIERWSARRMEFSGTLNAATFIEMQSRLDELKYRLAGQDLVVTVADDETREFRNVRFEEIPAALFRPHLIQTKTRVSLVAIANDPRGYSTADTVSASFGSTDLAMPLGTAEVGPVIRISGSTAGVVNPAVIYKNSIAAEIARLTLATTIGSTGFIDIDLEAFTLIDETGANVSDLLNSTASAFFRLDPKDGDFVNSSWATLQVTVGSAVATYRKAYL